MTRREMEERHIRSLTKVSSGTSYAVTIPMEYIRKLKWRSKQKLEVKLYPCFVHDMNTLFFCR